jgi:anti-sigma regulatory factor (Ser/Thr protein kinase)
VDLLTQVQAGDEPPAGPVSGEVRLVRAVIRSPLRGEAPPGEIAVDGTHDFGPASPHVVALAEGRPVLEPAVDPAGLWLAADPELAGAVRRCGIHSLMVVPLQVRGVILGTATFGRRKDTDPFTSADLSLADELGAVAAVHVDNARRYHRERLAALTLQHNLLPHGLPSQSALDVASRYLPADTETGVGGDWFDQIPLSGARVALVVGDVVGHGVYAAATMGRLRAAVQTLAGLDLPPDEVLGHLDDLVGRIAGEERHPTDAAFGAGVIGATCLYAVYDPVDRRLTAARAGHPPPLTVAPGAAAKVVPIPAGPPLGLGGFPFESVDIELPEGTLIALYTDGFFAAGRSDADDVIHQLGTVIAGAGGDLERTCDAVVETLLPGRPVDDAAFLLARTHALGSDQVASWDMPADFENVARSRRLAGEQLTAWGLEEIAFTAELVVSELVTNAIRHGSGPIRVRLIRDRTLICEVSDLSHTSPHLRRAATTDEGGRGLFIVARLTHDWGARYTSTGKTVWSEMPLTAVEIPVDVFVAHDLADPLTL